MSDQAGTDVATVETVEILDRPTGGTIDTAIADGASGQKWDAATADAALASLAERSGKWDSHVGVVAFKVAQADLIGSADGQRTLAEWAEGLGDNPTTGKPYSGQYFGQARILGAAIVLYGWTPGSDMYKRLRQARDNAAVKAHLTAAYTAPPETDADAEHSRDAAASLIGRALEPASNAGVDTSGDTSTQPTTTSRAVKAADALAVLLGNPWKDRPTAAQWKKIADALTSAADALNRVQTVEAHAEAEAAASGRLRASAEGNGRNGVTEPASPTDDADDAPEADAEPDADALADAAQAEAEATDDDATDAAPKPGPARKRASRK